MTDYYKVLGVPKQATQDEIKRAYRKLAKETHPDVNPNKDAQEKFVVIGEAYAILGDPEKRKTYHYRIARMQREVIRRRAEAQTRANSKQSSKDFNSGREYDEWVRQAREKAQSHAGMSYADFKKSRFFRTEAKLYLILQQFVFAFTILLSIFIMAIPTLLMFNFKWWLIFLTLGTVPLGMKLITEARKGLNILKKEFS